MWYFSTERLIIYSHAKFLLSDIISVFKNRKASINNNPAFIHDFSLGLYFIKPFQHGHFGIMSNKVNKISVWNHMNQHVSLSSEISNYVCVSVVVECNNNYRVGKGIWAMRKKIHMPLIDIVTVECTHFAPWQSICSTFLHLVWM